MFPGGSAAFSNIGDLTEFFSIGWIVTSGYHANLSADSFAISDVGARHLKHTHVIRCALPKTRQSGEFEQWKLPQRHSQSSWQCRWRLLHLMTPDTLLVPINRHLLISSLNRTTVSDHHRRQSTIFCTSGSAQSGETFNFMTQVKGHQPLTDQHQLHIPAYTCIYLCLCVCVSARARACTCVHTYLGGRLGRNEPDIYTCWHTNKTWELKPHRCFSKITTNCLSHVSSKISNHPTWSSDTWGQRVSVRWSSRGAGEVPGHNWRKQHTAVPANFTSKDNWARRHRQKNKINKINKNSLTYKHKLFMQSHLRRNLTHSHVSSATWMANLCRPWTLGFSVMKIKRRDFKGSTALSLFTCLLFFQVSRSRGATYAAFSSCRSRWTTRSRPAMTTECRWCSAPHTDPRTLTACCWWRIT